MIFGSPGSSSSFLRRRLTCVSMLRSSALAATAARQIEKLVAAQHALRPLDEGNQQIVFAGAERHRDAIVAKEFARAGVEPPAIEMVALGSAIGVRPARPYPGCAAGPP